MQAQSAQSAGAAAVLVYDNTINDYFVPAANGSASGIAIPAGAIPRRTGQLLVSAAMVCAMSGNHACICRSIVCCLCWCCYSPVASDRRQAVPIRSDAVVHRSKQLSSCRPTCTYESLPMPHNQNQCGHAHRRAAS